MNTIDIVIGVRISMEKVDEALKDGVPVRLAQIPTRFSKDKKYVYFGVCAFSVEYMGESTVRFPTPNFTKDDIRDLQSYLEPIGLWDGSSFNTWILLE